MVAPLPLVHTFLLLQAPIKNASDNFSVRRTPPLAMPPQSHRKDVFSDVNTKPRPSISQIGFFCATAAAAFTILASSAAEAYTGNIIVGPSNAEMLQVTLKPGDGILVEPGSFLYSTDGIELRRTFRGGSTSGRLFLGAKIAMDVCTNTGNQNAEVGLTPHFPSRIIAIHLEDYGGTILGNTESFLAARSDVDLDYGWDRVEGQWRSFYQPLERMTGRGRVFLVGSGNIIVKEIGTGEKIRLFEGAWVAMTDHMNLRYVKERDSFFSDYNLEVQGPGTIWIDTAPISRIVRDIEGRLPKHD